MTAMNYTTALPGTTITDSSIGTSIVSVFDNIYQPNSPHDWTLGEMLNHIRDGTVADQIAIIRMVQNDAVSSHDLSANLFAELDRITTIIPRPEERTALALSRAAYLQDPHAKNTREDIVSWLKKGLPGITFSGRFSQRGAKHLLQHSSVICIDFDDLADPYQKAIEVRADQHCITAFVSPTGTGLKALFRVPRTDAQEHRQQTFPKVAEYLQAKFGLMADKAASDVSRLCYLSHDPSMTINSAAIEFSVPVSISNAAPAELAMNNSSYVTPGDDFNARGDVAAVLRQHGWASSDDTNWTRPGKSSGTSATLGVVEGPPRSFWVFSNNASPFVPNKRYEPWHVFTMLECNGDFAGGTSKLRDLGYGTPTGEKTVLILPSSIGPTISESADTIFQTIAKKQTMFARGRVPHEVVSDERGLKLEPIKSVAFRSRLEKYGQLMAWKSDSAQGRRLVPALCSDQVATALLATTEANDRLPNIKQVIKSPALALEGDELVVLKQGWNPHNGGVFVVGGQLPPEVALEEAKAALLGLFDDFEFQTDADTARALASLITPALKAGGLLTCSTPIDVCEADKSQAGKGFMRKLVTAVYDEVPSLVSQKDGGVGSFDELIAAALLTGRPFVQLDNLRGKVSSTNLEALITAEGPFPCRVPHQPTVEVDVRTFNFAITSNGMESTRDLANRCSFIRLKKRPQNYVFKVFSEGGLLEHIKAHQPYFLGCVFAIVREWVKQGRQRSNEWRHDFRTWAQTLDWIVGNIFDGPCLMDGHNEARDRVSDPARSWLRAIALKLADENRLDHEVTATSLAELSDENDLPLPNSRSEADDMSRARAVGKAMSKLFSGENSVQVDDFTVTRIQKYSQSAEKMVPYYRFSRG